LERSERDARPLLEAANVRTGYGRKTALHDVSLQLHAGEAIALIGHNGAGKTTLLRALFGLQSLWGGSVRLSAGSTHASTGLGPAAGMSMVPAERFVFQDLTVGDNLLLSARGLGAATRKERIDQACVAFPVLKERWTQLAGSLSGGQQRMVSLTMALMTKPRLLLLDEPSLGLSPAIVEQIMASIRKSVAEGMAVILVEQNVPAALSVASRVYVLRGGRILQEESSAALLARGRDSWWSLF
jgi:branched-chain amino acid transport system ATP-binding protein